MREIPITKGLVAMVDDADYQDLNKFRWSADNNGGRQTYAARKEGPRGGQKKITMHRQIMGFPPRPLVVDHINGDPLDNRRCNLRLTDHRGNAANSAKRQGSSRFKGVCWDAERGLWFAQIKTNGAHINLGRFQDERAAAEAYDAAAREHHGEFAKTNFPLNAGR